MNIGIKRAKSILTSSGDTDLLEQILSILLSTKDETLFKYRESLELKLTAGEEAESSNDVSFDLVLLVKWLKLLSECDKFELMVRFANNKLITDAIDCLEQEGIHKVESTLAKFCLGKKP